MSFLKSIFGRHAKGSAQPMSLERMEDVIDAYTARLLKGVGEVESDASLPVPKSEIEAAILMKAPMMERAEREVLEAAFTILGKFVPLTEAETKAIQLYQFAKSQASSALQMDEYDTRDEDLKVMLNIITTNAPTHQTVMQRSLSEMGRLKSIWEARFS